MTNYGVFVKYRRLWFYSTVKFCPNRSRRPMRHRQITTLKTNTFLPVAGRLDAMAIDDAIR